jgi:ATP-binding cassette subfamily B (MDR/TAP) protein 6
MSFALAQDQSHVNSIYPPFYSSHAFAFSSPWFIAPTILISYILLCGGTRYLQIRHNPLFSNGNHSSSSSLARLSSLGKLVALLSIIVTFSFVVDAAVIVLRVFIEGTWTSVTLSYYIVTSYLAWTLSLILLTQETQAFGQWYWIQYAFWILATLTDCSVGWLWALGLKYSRDDQGKERTPHYHLLVLTHSLSYQALCLASMTRFGWLSLSVDLPSKSSLSFCP